MKIRKEFLFLSMIFIIFLAGCTSSSSTGTGAGLVVKSFTAAPSSVEGGTPVLLTLDVQNSGESDATSVRAELIGLPFTIGDRVKQVGTGTIVRSDPQLGLPQGEEQVVLWDITTTPTDTTTSYEAKARITYNYVTSSENVIRVVSSDYYRTLSSADQQNLKRGVISSQYTKGPLAVTVITPQPVVPTGTIALPVQIQIDNLGTGRAFIGVLSVSNLDRVSIDAPGLNCPQSDVRLVSGKTGRLTCQPTISVSGQTELQYTITVRYEYYVDTTTTFSVTKSLGVTPSAVPVPSGSLGQQCRAGNTCDSGLVCSNNVCVGSGTVPTGGVGQQCRTTSPQCDTGLSCSNNFCVQPNTGSTGGTTVTCTCDNPNQATPNNHFTCTDTSKSGYCTPTDVCTSSSSWVWPNFPCAARNTGSTGGATCPQDFSSQTPSGTTCPSSCYVYKSFLNECRTNYENSQAITCESTAVANGHYQWNWAAHNCFFVSSSSTTSGAPIRSNPTVNGADASGSTVSIPTQLTTASIGLTTNKAATCRNNFTTTQTTYDSMTAFSSTGSTTHTTSVNTANSGNYVFNILCSDGTNTNTDQFIIRFNK